MPIVLIIIPIVKTKKDLINESPDRLLSSSMPTRLIAKYSGGPKESAALPSGGAKSISKTTPMVPATHDPMPATASAAPALPFRAIWYPSRQVTTDAASPGTLIRIDVVDPPYMAP